MARTTALRAYLTPAPLAAFALGVSSGFPLTLLLGTMTLWLSRVGINIKTIGLVSAVGTPYVFKFLWAPLIDRVPLPGLARLIGQRRAWLFLVQTLLVIGLVALGASDPAHNIGRFIIFAVTVAFLAASQDIIIDAYRIEMLPPEQLVYGTAMNQFGYRFGNLLAGAGTIWLASNEGAGLGWATAYGLTALLVLPGTVAAILMGPGVHDLAMRSGVRARSVVRWLKDTVVAPLWEFLRRRGAWLILVYIIFYKFGDAFGQIMLSPMLVHLGYSDKAIIAANKLVGFWTLIAGTAIAAPALARWGAGRCLMASSFGMAAANLGFALLAASPRSEFSLAAAVGFESFVSGLGLTVFVTWLASLANVAYTGTQYALLSSAAGLARTFLNTRSGIVATALGYPRFFLCAAALSLPGVLLLWLVSRGPAGAGLRRDVPRDSAVQSA